MQHCIQFNFKSPHFQSQSQHCFKKVQSDPLTIIACKIKIKQITCFQHTMAQNIHYHPKREHCEEILDQNQNKNQKGILQLLHLNLWCFSDLQFFSALLTAICWGLVLCSIYSDVDFCASKSNYSRSMGIVINIEESPASIWYKECSLFISDWLIKAWRVNDRAEEIERLDLWSQLKIPGRRDREEELPTRLGRVQEMKDHKEGKKEMAMRLWMKRSHQGSSLWGQTSTSELDKKKLNASNLGCVWWESS